MDETQILRRLADARPVRLLTVWAHPDDEAYLGAGLMARFADAGARVTCVTATRGEQGTVPGAAVSPDRLAQRREAELRASLAQLGTHSLRLLGHPDGGCAAVPVEAGAAAVQRAIEAVRPDLIVTFGPDGVTGHPDHVAVHRWTTVAWQRTGQGELLYAVLAEEFLLRYQWLHDRTGFFGDHRPVGHPAAALDVTIDLSDRELDRKRRALAAHASQTEALAATVGDSTYRRWWARESFRRPTEAEMAAASAPAAHQLPGAA